MPLSPPLPPAQRTRTVVKKLADKEEVAVAFSLCEDSDVENVIPMLKSMIHHATVPIHVYASPFAPYLTTPLLQALWSDIEYRISNAFFW